MSHVLLLDTNVWSHLILSDPAKRQKVQADLAALLSKYPGATRATSRICVGECLVAARRLPSLELRASAEQDLMAYFDNPELIIVEVNAQITSQAASWRAESLLRAAAHGGPPVNADGGKLKLPDALIAASCLDFSPPAILVTENVSDFEFMQNQTRQTVGNLVIEAVG